MRLALFILVGMLAAPAGAAEVVVPGATARCEQVEFSAAQSTCDAERCRLDGSAHLTCEGLQLWAEHLELRFDEARAFAGAEAHGNVLLVDGKVVLTCDRVVLGKDRIQGQVLGATVRLRERPVLPAALAGGSVPPGKNTSILTGDVERLDPNHLVIDDGTFTLCDCGDDPPSWRIDASSIDVELGERAVLWWPHLRISPFGLGPLPVTPPLLPVSLPLKDRAWGLLPPRLAFFGIAPMFDLPFFVPLGDSWDVTFQAGLRTDWVRNLGFNPARWGAPRAGGRVRWAPLDGVHGELRTQWTWDRRHFVSRDYFRDQNVDAELQAARAAYARTGAEADLGAVQTFEARQERVQHETDRLRELEHRMTVELENDVRLPFDVRWLTDVEWLSDDRMRLDFGLALQEQLVNYVPSRSQLVWTPHDLPLPIAAALSVDYLLRIDNDPDTLLNTRGAELHAPHRGPAVRASLAPTAVLADFVPGLHVDADLDFARYGSFAPEDPARLVAGGGELGLSWRHNLGPVATFARLAGHGWLSDAADTPETAAGFLLAEAGAELTLARRFGEYVHTITPKLAYRGLPEVWGDSAADIPALQDGPDEHLDVAAFHQVAVSLEQSLWRGGTRVERLATLTLQVPFDLLAPEVLSLTARLGWRLGALGTGDAWVVVNPNDEREPLQEAGVAANTTIGPAALGVTYLRFAPSAERFHRTWLQLAGSRAPVFEPTDWVHSITPSVRLAAERVHLSYAAIILLPQPGAGPLVPPRPAIGRHTVGGGYTSSCDCWGIGVNASIPGTGTAQEVEAGLRVMVTLDVGGYVVGNTR